MDNVEEFNKAAHALLEANVRLNTIRIQLEALERDIATLVNIELQILENINTLKRQKIVTLAVAYRKALENLNAARNRLAFFRIDRENVLKLMTKAEAVKIKAELIHNEKMELMRNPPSNVIDANFEKRTWQRR